MRFICKGRILDEEKHNAAKELVLAGMADITFPNTFRLPCGFCLDDIILGTPFDGEERRASCPNCGNIFSFRNA